ncbi:hypothetical protein Tco_1295542 [Tanacetum coccineum]
MTTNGALRSSTGQCKVVNADHETPNIPISSSKLNNLHGVSFLSDSDSQVAQNNEETMTEVLQCELPLKEQNPWNFTLPCTIGKFYLGKVIDCFKDALDPDKDPMERSFDDYKWVFDPEIEQLADEYELGIGKNDHILEMI